MLRQVCVCVGVCVCVFVCVILRGRFLCSPSYYPKNDLVTRAGHKFVVQQQVGYTKIIDVLNVLLTKI